MTFVLNPSDPVSLAQGNGRKRDPEHELASWNIFFYRSAAEALLRSMCRAFALVIHVI